MKPRALNPFDSDDDEPPPPPPVTTAKLPPPVPPSKSLNPFSDDDDPPLPKPSPARRAQVPNKPAAAGFRNKPAFDNNDDNHDDLSTKPQNSPFSKTSITKTNHTNPINPIIDGYDEEEKVSSNVPRPSKSLAVKEKDTEIAPGKPRSLSSHFHFHSGGKASSSVGDAAAAAPRFPPVFKNKSAFGSADFRELFGHKENDADPRHGTRFKDASAAAAVSGSKDVALEDYYASSEKAKDLFGYADAKKGHDLSGGGAAAETAATEVQSRAPFGFADAADTKSARAGFVGEDDDHSPDLAPSAPSAVDYVNQAVQDLQDYALTKAEDTTETVMHCVRVAEETRGMAGSTLETLHSQGVQIERTHGKAVQLEQRLAVGEKLLNSLGGIFSKSWKPKKTRKITGPMTGNGEPVTRRGTPADRAALGLTDGQNYADAKAPRSAGSSPALARATSFESRLEMERKAQDDGLSQLGSIVGQLKEMSFDMNKEVMRQSEGIDHLQGDVEELHSRVQQSNVRTRKLLRR